jgi:hypothetical protein
MAMFETINLAFLVAIALIVWFQSDAFEKYVKFFRLGWLFWMPLFDQQREDNPLLTYPTFLRLNFPNMLVWILTCPTCLAVWLAAIVTLCCGSLLMWPTVVVVGLGTYHLLRKLINS